MEHGRVCPRCGGATPTQGAFAGLCPSCLGRRAIEADPPADPEAGILFDDPSPPLGLTRRAAPRRFGDYELLEEIACGGMGVVYRARQSSLNRIVALKTVLAPNLSDPTTVMRFRLEAEAAAQLHHPHIVAIHEIGEVQGLHYYTMDFVEGRSLAEYARQQAFAPDRAAACVRGVAEAIHHAHQHGILHRDLKPSNVLIDGDDLPHVTDFGLAKLMDSDTELTLSGQVLGSPSYMAPEQAEGQRQAVSVRSDIYSLGAVLYELLTGRPPFMADSVVATLKQVVEQSPVRARVINPRVPEDLETICLKCLEKHPSRRYESAQALANDLGRFLAGQPILARPIGLPDLIWRWCRRNSGLATATVAALLAMLLGVAGIVGQWRSAESYRQLAEREERSTRQHLYAADMHAAGQALEGHNLGLARRLLASHRPGPGEEDLRGFEWRHLWSRVQGEHMGVFPGHSNVVTALAFSPNGRLLVSAGREACLRIWEVQNRRLQATLPSLTGHVFRVAFSPDGRHLAVGATDGVQLWDTASWQVSARIPCPSASVAFAPSGALLAIGESNVIWGSQWTGSTRVWDVDRGLELLCLTNAGGRAAFSADGSTLATGNWDDAIRLWEMPSGRPLQTLTNGFRLLALECSPDGRAWATAQWDRGPALRAVANPGLAESLGDYSSRIRTVAFSPDGRMLAVAGSDQTVDLWDTATRRLLRRLQGHGQEIWSLAFSPTGDILASGGRDDGVLLWRVAAQPPANTLTGLVELLGQPVFAISSNGTRVAALCSSGIGVWDTVGLDPVLAPREADAPLGFYPDDRTLVTLRRPASLIHWDVATGRAIRQVELALSFDRLNDCRLSPSGRWLALGDAAAVLHVLDTKTGLTVSQPQPHFRYVLALGFSRDEKLLASSDRTSAAFLWDLPDLRPRAVLLGHRDYIRGLAISPDGTLLATASADCTARIWQLPAGAELAVLRGHREELNDVAFSPDGQTLATSSYDRSVRLWHLRTFREVAVLPHQDRVLRLAFSADGRVLAAMARDGSIRFWPAPALIPLERTGDSGFLSAQHARRAFMAEP